MIATGAQYNKPSIPNSAGSENVGVCYGATNMEAQLCEGEEVIVGGGGNSAGQAAVYLTQVATHVHVAVRSDKLSDTMSRYLIQRIETHPKITIHYQTEITGLEGDVQLERVQWRNKATGKTETRPIRHIFMMTGASPNTAWLEDCMVLDNKGFIMTGHDLQADDRFRSRWSAVRSPMLLETSLAGVFAVGDARSGNVKRVASAVGEGSIAIHLVHREWQRCSGLTRLARRRARLVAILLEAGDIVRVQERHPDLIEAVHESMTTECLDLELFRQAKIVGDDLLFEVDR